jgi:hypothetical protein
MQEHFTRRRVVAAGLVLMALLAWLLWPNSQLVRVQELQRELAVQGRTPEERRELFGQLRAETEKLSAEDRAKLAAERRQRFEAEIARYSALSAAEKKKLLDEQIDRMESMRRQNTNNGANAGPPPGAGIPNSGGQQKTPEQRERRRQERLDQTSPEFRAQMDQYRKDMEQRRQQRGLPSSPGRPPRG